MKEKIKKYIGDNNLIISGDKVCVALSGGIDSCCLLHILVDLSDDMNFCVEAIHVNHMLRGGESDSDEEFCKKTCDGYGIPLKVFKIDVRDIAKKQKMTLEEAARAGRYQVFEKNCEGRVAVAHNMNDNAETVLMNLMRGSGPEGLGGISPETGRYIRPLLETGRDEIEQYCKINKIDYVDDSSNKDTSFFRNAVRHKLIPLMNGISGKDISGPVSRTAYTMTLLNSYVDSMAEKAFSDIAKIIDGRVILDNDTVMGLHPYMASCVIRKAVEKIKGDLKDVEFKNTEILTDLIRKNRTGSATQLPGDVYALIQFKKTVIYKEREILPPFEYKLPVPGKISIKERNITVTARYSDSNEETDPKGDRHCLHFDSCKYPIYVRTRKNGDIIKPRKGRGTVKLKKYFIDKKVKLPWRNEKLLIACGSSVAYVEGMDYGKDYMPGGDNNNIIIEIGRETGDA